MARGKGKRGGGRGGGKRFAAQSAEEIEQRNARLAEFDADREKRRAEAAEEENGGGGAKKDGDAFDPSVADAEREAMLVGRRVAGMSMDGSDDDDDEYVKKERKNKGLEGIIETDNPNKAGTNPRMMKAKDMASAEAAPMTRKEREEKEKAERAAAYRKRHEAGLTEEYKRDMAKLAEVKRRREAAQAKAKAEQEAAIELEENRKKEVEKANASIVDFENDEEEKSKKKKKKSSSKDIPKLDKIAIKKMKPAALKEALEARGLDKQGNAKTLTERLLKYEKERS
mmetsp:Transcript_7177/g.9550  ORF Transcript_7177/g.9550 Transcript_7177/m.9550 type:complete len:284 (+) Transcript_7177:81-932(+)